MIRYRLISGSDPLGWARNVPADALAGKPMTSRQWLEATTDTEFPDLATGLLAVSGPKTVGDEGDLRRARPGRGDLARHGNQFGKQHMVILAGVTDTRRECWCPAVVLATSGHHHSREHGCRR